MNPVIFIPARLDSKRLPNKLLLDVAGKSIIQRVWEGCLSSGIPVFVASSDHIILNLIKDIGGNVVQTQDHHESGTDRIAEALSIVDPQGYYDMIINVQGDLPNVNSCIINTLIQLMCKDFPVGTLISPIDSSEEKYTESIVKAVLAKDNRVLYFSRTCVPFGYGIHYHHIGIYSYRRDILFRFSQLPISYLESQEKLEQLRFLEDGISIYASIIENPLFSINTKSDLEFYRYLLQ